MTVTVPSVGPPAPLENDATGIRCCVACGYNLYGLGDEPRCPECGLLNIPQALRRQVWELVDSGKWFFSGMFHPFRRRPAGWWWALDRPGDLRRSVRFAAVQATFAGALLFAAVTINDAIRVREVNIWRIRPQSTSEQVEIVEHVLEFGFASGLRDYQEATRRFVDAQSAPTRFSATRTVLWRWTLASPEALVPLLAWILATWAGPAAVGFWTQIRKGLPDFARAPRTIIAASMYEAHRLIYLSAMVALWGLLDVAMRINVPSTRFSMLAVMIPVLSLLAVLTLFGAAGWVGPARSDYTRQLVRSRFHAARIIVMYAVALPWGMAFLAAAAVHPME